MDELMKGVLERIRKQQYYENEDILRVFISQVENGAAPPQRVLQFMSDGAREFLRGGKPWQNGKGGRPAKGYGENELRQFLLRHYGKLSPAKIATALGLRDENGKDVERTVRRDIDRGSLAFFVAQINQIEALERLFDELITAEFKDLTSSQRRKCIDGLRAGRDEVSRNRQGPNAI